MPIQEVSISFFADQIRNEAASGTMITLAGAGVSMAGPSRLPSGHALRDSAVLAVCDVPELQPYLQRAWRNSRYESITPEIVFERFQACLQNIQLTPFFLQLKHASPNAVHQFVGTLAEHTGHLAYTTNFDELLEGANPTINVQHLHGTLSRPSQLMATIHRIGRGTPTAVAEQFRHDIANRTLLVLGYSGSDRDIFDLVRHSNVSRLLWLVRDSSDWAWPRIVDYAEHADIVLANGEFADLLAQFNFDASGLESYPQPRKLAARKRVIEKWSQGARLIDRFACLSQLLFEIEDYDGALQTSQAALPFAYDTELAGWFRIQIADAYKILGDFTSAEASVREALTINEALHTPHDIAGACNNLGTLLLEKEDPDFVSALPFLMRALAELEAIDKRRISRKRRDGVYLTMGRVLNNLGLAYETAGDYEMAIETYEAALKVKAKLGDLLGIAKTTGNVAIVRHIQADPEAEAWFLSASDLMKSYDLRRDFAYVLERIGADLCQKGDIAKGGSMLLEAYELCRSLPDRVYLMTRVANLADKWSIPLPSNV